MNKQKHHAYIYPCPICQTILTGCNGIDCEDCDQFDDDTSDCNGHEEMSDHIMCECNHQQVVAHLICQNIELQEELDSLLEQLYLIQLIDSTS